jgi:hypothetical protein
MKLGIRLEMSTPDLACQPKTSNPEPRLTQGYQFVPRLSKESNNQSGILRISQLNRHDALRR